MSMTILSPSSSTLSIETAKHDPHLCSALSNARVKTSKKKIISAKANLQSVSESSVLEKEKVPNPGPVLRNMMDIEKGQCGDSCDMPNLPEIQKETEILPYKIPNEPKYEALPLLKQRLGYFWEKKMYTDVLFKVGPKEIPIEAHRMILATVSDSFQKLLYENKPLFYEDKFVLYEPEFSPTSFEVFIKAFYTNEISICLTLPIALELFYATKKYNVGFLQDQVLNHIKTSVGISNVFEALQVSTSTHELTFIAPVCWQIIEENTKEVLEYHLDSMESYTLVRILERDRSSLEEFELYQFLVKWASIQCKNAGIKVTGKTKRQFIESFLKHIRFTTMKLLEFNEFVIPSRILEKKEIHAILTYLNGSDPRLRQPIPYKTNRRLKFSINSQTTSDEVLIGEMSNKSKSDSVVSARKIKSERVHKKRSSGKSNRNSNPTPRPSTASSRKLTAAQERVILFYHLNE